jgi:hypothetical protein
MVMPAASLAATRTPSIASAFTPNSIAVGGTSSLSFTITNPNASGSLSGISFTDTLPSGVVVDNPNGESGTCGSSSTITGSTGSSTISLTGGSVSAGNNCTFSVNVTSNTAGVYQNTTGPVSSTNGGTGNSDAESLTVVAPPTIALSSPRNNATYSFGKRVITSFTCQEAANGPGLIDCTGSVDSGNDLNSGAPLLTSVAGPHTFTVTAVSSDGQLVTDTVNYTVKPDNRFTVSHAKAASTGWVSFQVKVPGGGKVNVRELAGRSTFGAKTVRVGRAGTIKVKVAPGPRGIALVASKPTKLVIRLQVTFAPKGGVARKTTISGVRVS